MIADAKPAVVITGASTGIGYACVEDLARDHHVFAGVRREEDAARLIQTFGASVTPLPLDVRDPEEVEDAADTVRAALGGRTLAGLVNNAGVPSGGPLLHAPIAEIAKVLDVNLLGVVRCCQAFGPLLGADKALEGAPGRIVMMSSVAGKIGFPFGGAYVASKHALEGISDVLRRELMIYGIDIVVIGPGSVATPIWDKATSIDYAPYRGTDYQPIMDAMGDVFLARGRAGLPPSAIAKLVRRALTAKRPRTRYAVSPHPFTSWILPRLLPPRVLDRIVARIAGLKRVR
jgi:NAD(P)-dependent dehydrogenase (short-subunit alcohol dehydrogenase family)